MNEVQLVKMRIISMFLLFLLVTLLTVVLVGCSLGFYYNSPHGNGREIIDDELPNNAIVSPNIEVPLNY